VRNVRFMPMALIDDKEETMPAETIVGQVCDNFCDTLYLSCKSVEWKDRIEFIYSGSANDYDSVSTRRNPPVACVVSRDRF
jgi:hypothetical protein